MRTSSYAAKCITWRALQPSLVLTGLSMDQSINQSINARFVGRRYTTRPGAPTIVNYKLHQKVHWKWWPGRVYLYGCLQTDMVYSPA